MIIVGLFLTQWSVDLKLSLLLLLLIIMLFVIFWFKPRLFFYDQQYGYLKLIDTQGKPVKTKHDVDHPSFINRLIKMEFKVFVSNEAYAVIHRYTKDATNFITKRPMLEIIALIYKQDMPYHDQEISKIINMIEDDYLKRKTKFTNYTVLQLKMGEVFDELSSKDYDQVVFDVQAGRHITVINGFYAKKTNEVSFLYSEIYYPTAFYQYGVDLMKKIL
jgi:hypothetical protein